MTPQLAQAILPAAVVLIATVAMAATACTSNKPSRTASPSSDASIDTSSGGSNTSGGAAPDSEAGNSPPDGAAPNGGQVLVCDESSDCTSGDVCCAERSLSDDQRITTTCRTSCITNEPRVKVCKTDGECGPGGSCQPSPCDRGPANLRYCERPFFCD